MKSAVKKFFISILFTVTAVCTCAAYSACSPGGNGGAGSGGNGSATGKWDEYDGVKLAFFDEAGYNNGDMDDRNASPELNCKLDEKYYMVIDFDIQAPYDNDGRESVTAEVRIKPAVAVKATIQDTNTGNVKEETDGDITNIEATYKIPEKAGTVRNMRLVIQLKALISSEVYIDTAFVYDGEIKAVNTDKINKTVSVNLTDVLIYEEDGGDYSVVGVDDNTIEKVVIPIMKDGYYIRKIGDDAFKDCGELTEIVMCDGITAIGYSAFYGCAKLTGITISKNLTEIPIYAFANCTSLTNIIIPDTVKGIGGSAFKGCGGLTSITLPFIGGGDYVEYDKTYTHFGYIFGAYTYSDNAKNVPSSLREVVVNGGESISSNAFYNCDKLTKITIGEGVQILDLSAFSGCNALTGFAIPDSVCEVYGGTFVNEGITKVVNTSSSHFEADSETVYVDNWAIRWKKYSSRSTLRLIDGTKGIANSAFFGCTFQGIYIPKSVKYIGSGAFRGCGALTTITVEEDNINYKSVGNCLLTKDGRTLILGCQNSKIPAGVTDIGDSFYQCTGLQSIEIPQGVKSLEKSSFYGCSGLTSITIPASVTEIGVSAFGGCNKLTSINFKGTMQQWKTVQKVNYYDYKTGDFTVHCTDGDLTKSES